MRQKLINTEDRYTYLVKQLLLEKVDDPKKKIAIEILIDNAYLIKFRPDKKKVNAVPRVLFKKDFEIVNRLMGRLDSYFLRKEWYK